MTRDVTATLTFAVAITAGILAWVAHAADSPAPVPAPLPALEKGDVIVIVILRRDKPIGTARLVWDGSWASLPPAPPILPVQPPPDKPGTGNPTIHQ